MSVSWRAQRLRLVWRPKAPSRACRDNCAMTAPLHAKTVVQTFRPRAKKLRRGRPAASRARYNMKGHIVVRFIRCGAEWIAQFLLFDEVRLLELYSALNLLAWAQLMLAIPDAFHSGAYSGFDSMSPGQWAALFSAVAGIQVFATLRMSYWFYELRLLGMALAAGAWTVVAVNFWRAEFATTANWNYTLLALACAISGGFLGWKNTSYHS